MVSIFFRGWVHGSNFLLGRHSACGLVQVVPEPTPTSEVNMPGHTQSDKASIFVGKLRFISGPKSLEVRPVFSTMHEFPQVAIPFPSESKLFFVRPTWVPTAEGLSESLAAQRQLTQLHHHLAVAFHREVPRGDGVLLPLQGVHELQLLTRKRQLTFG